MGKKTKDAKSPAKQITDEIEHKKEVLRNRNNRNREAQKKTPRTKTPPKPEPDLDAGKNQ